MVEGEGWRRILCGFVERVCGMAEDIVRRGCGGMGERWRDGAEAWRSGAEAWRSGTEAWRSGAEAWRSGAEWQREIERKVERSCGMVERE